MLVKPDSQIPERKMSPVLYAPLVGSQGRAASKSGRLLAAWPAGRVDRARDYYYTTKTPAAAGVSDWMLWR